MFRILLGIGMGGEWASGAALVSETWPAEHRGKALGLMQSAWAIGYGLAAAVTMIVLPRWGWRVVFFIGVLPALLTFWVRRHVREPELWLTHARIDTRPRGRLGDVFRDGRAGVTIAVTHERLHAVRVVGLQPVAAGLPVDAGRVRGHRACRPRSCRGSSSRCRSACGSATSPSATSATRSAASARMLPTW